MLKKMFVPALLAMAAVSCNKLETVGVGALDNRNVALDVIYTYDTLFLTPNQLITNDVGSRFYIQDVQMIVWNFNVESDDTTIESPTSYAVSTLANPSVKVARFQGGTYSGFYGFTVGVADPVNLLGPAQFPADHPLKPAGLYSPAPIGYHYLTISGLAIPAGAPANLPPSIPFKLVIASKDLKSNFQKFKTFVLSSGGTVNLSVEVDLEPLLNNFPLGLVNEVKSDPADAQDYAKAQQLQQIFQSQCVFLY
jgi:hypothetical protein